MHNCFFIDIDKGDRRFNNSSYAILLCSKYFNEVPNENSSTTRQKWTDQNYFGAVGRQS